MGVMPIPCPHFKITIVKRSQGQSAVAGAAYQSGERLFSEYDQRTKFYNKKKELVHAEIMLPSYAPPGYADRATLWNAVEAVENQWNSQLARRIVLAFPVEVPKEQYLYEQGVVGRNNKNIPNTSIVRMIKNKGYTGYLINGAVETECPQLRIIEPELFEQAQELRQARTCERGGTSLGTSSKALLTGLVYCAHCGNRLSLTSSGRIHTYADGHTVKEVRPRYSCFYKIRHPGDCDGQSGYGVSKLDSIVEEVVRQIFAQFREVSRKKLLESVKTNDAARIQKKINWKPSAVL